MENSAILFIFPKVQNFLSTTFTYIFFNYVSNGYLLRISYVPSMFKVLGTHEWTKQNTLLLWSFYASAPEKANEDVHSL